MRAMAGVKKGIKIKLIRIFEFSLVLLLLAMMIAFYFTGRAKNIKQDVYSPDAEMELKGRVFLSRFENGELRLVLKGKNLSYDRGQNEAVLFKPEIEIKGESGEILVNAGRGVSLNNGDSFQLIDGVRIIYDRYQAVSDSLNYNLKTGLVESDDEIEIKGRGMELSGKGYKFDTKKGEIQILSSVKGRFKKQKG